MPAEAQGALDAMYRDAHRGDAPPLVQRWWNVNPADPLDGIHIVASPQRTIALPAMLGITAGDESLSAIGEVLGHDALAPLRRNPLARVVYLSDVVANQLGAKVGQTVSVGGIDLDVAGIFDADEFDQKATALGGDSLAPLKYTRDELDSSGHRLDAGDADDLGTGREAAGSSSFGFAVRDRAGVGEQAAAEPSAGDAGRGARHPRGRRQPNQSRAVPGPDERGTPSSFSRRQRDVAKRSARSVESLLTSHPPPEHERRVRRPSGPGTARL